MGSEQHDEGHHLPAEEDWPKGFGEASWWPFVTAAGAAGIYIGAALYVLAQQEVVGSIVGIVVLLGSIGLMVAGVFGWLYHAFMANYWDRDADPDSADRLRWGMITFIGSEIAVFSAGFVYYFWIRAGAWPPHEFPALTTSLVLANTAILIASSFTLHWAHHELTAGNRRNFLLGLGTTLLLGIVFLGGQLLEYYEFIVQYGFSISSGIYASAFYGLTALHGLHVSLGAVLLAIVLYRALQGHYSPERDVSVGTASMYWHYVDVVWVFLVVVLYAGAII